MLPALRTHKEIGLQLLMKLPPWPLTTSPTFFKSDGPSFNQSLEFLQTLPIPSLDPSKADFLACPPLPSEIKAAVFELPKHSAPGPDGYHANFFQKNWSLVSHDVIAMVSSSWNFGHLLKSMNKTNVVLIPKKDNPSSFQDLRPISLSNVTYKILSKVICNRLKSVLHDLIHPCQSAFLKGRLITDNIMLASDLLNQIHTSRGKRKKLAAFKIDFSKAFDRVSWTFLMALLSRMNFPPTLIHLIYHCLSTVEYHFMLNGQEIFHLEPNRGIRQGDPLSPYLFILLANVLSCQITVAVQNNLWKGIKISRNSQPISHLMLMTPSFLWRLLNLNFVVLSTSWTPSASGLGKKLIRQNLPSFSAPIPLILSGHIYRIFWASNSHENLANTLVHSLTLAGTSSLSMISYFQL